MTQLTRDNFVTELKARGWSRFSDASLQRYLDWALQDVYRLGKFEAVKDVSATGSLVADDAKVTFTTVGTAAPNIHAINAVNVKDTSGHIWPLTVATREMFWSTMYPNENEASANQTKGIPSHYYVYGEDVHLWPVCNAAYDWYIHYTGRADTFSSGSATSGLPERMDTAILAAAEAQCCKRARDMAGFAVAMQTLEKLIDGEVANERRQFTEEEPRIGRYEH